MKEKTGRSIAIISCPKCGSIMAATQTRDGSVFICGHCRHEIPLTPRGVTEE
jgi:DNA-directed RNA polymerase subunit M/transcription elongation factor TFIIS